MTIDTASEIVGTTAEISYLAAGSDINRRFAAPGAELNTGRYEAHSVQIRNARPNRASFTLDSHGFVLADHKSRVNDFFNKEEVNAIYPGEVAETVKRLTGATSVAAMGWMVRTSGDLTKFARQTAGYTHQGGVQPPAADAHVDMLPEVAERMAKMTYERSFPNGPGYRRFIASSFWRAFSEPPQDYPLAVCDGHSVGSEEGVRNTLIVVDKIPDRSAMFDPIPDEDTRPAAAVFRYNPSHRWWYFPNMTRDEAILLKFHDSDRSKAWRVPHTAFHDTSFKNARTRESIEFRTVAFFE